MACPAALPQQRTRSTQRNILHQEQQVHPSNSICNCREYQSRKAATSTKLENRTMDKRTNKSINPFGNYRVTFARVLSAMMAALLLVTTMPVLPAYAAPPLVVPEGAGPPHLGVMPDHAHIRGGEHKLVKIEPKLSFSNHPTDLELSTARVFLEPLAAMSGQVVPGENEALAQALLKFKKKTDPDDVSDLKGFLATFPKSRWAPSVELNLGLIRFETGYLFDALVLLRSSWDGAKKETGTAQRAVANRAVAKLLLFDARL